MRRVMFAFLLLLGWALYSAAERSARVMLMLPHDCLRKIEIAPESYCKGPDKQHLIYRKNKNPFQEKMDRRVRLR